MTPQNLAEAIADAYMKCDFDEISVAVNSISKKRFDDEMKYYQFLESKNKVTVTAYTFNGFNIKFFIDENVKDFELYVKPKTRVL